MCYATVPSRARLVPVAKAATLDEVEALAASYEKPIADAIVKALEQSGEGIDLDALAQALASGNLQAALNLLNINFGPAADAIQNVAWAGGALATDALKLSGIEWHFNRLNPVLIQWLQNYTLGLIRELTDSTREAVRAQLTAGMQAGLNPRTQAQTIKQIVGLTTRQSNAVFNFRKELEGFHSKTSAGGYNLGAKIDRVNGAQVFKPDDSGNPKDGIRERRLRDFRYDGQLQRSMTSGKPLTPAQIDKMVGAYARKYRKFRAEMIARTESMRAVNMGTQEAFRQAVDAGKVSETLVRRFWKVAYDERTCEICQPIPYMNEDGVKLGQPFATPDGATFLPPMHPDCRCHVFIRVLEPQQLKGGKL